MPVETAGAEGEGVEPGIKAFVTQRDEIINALGIAVSKRQQVWAEAVLIVKLQLQICTVTRVADCLLVDVMPPLLAQPRHVPVAGLFGGEVEWRDDALGDTAKIPNVATRRGFKSFIIAGHKAVGARRWVRVAPCDRDHPCQRFVEPRLHSVEEGLVVHLLHCGERGTGGRLRSRRRQGGGGEWALYVQWLVLHPIFGSLTGGCDCARNITERRTRHLCRHLVQVTREIHIALRRLLARLTVQSSPRQVML